MMAYHSKHRLGLLQLFKHFLVGIFIRHGVSVRYLRGVNVRMVQQPAHQRLDT